MLLCLGFSVLLWTFFTVQSQVFQCQLKTEQKAEIFCSGTLVKLEGQDVK